MKDKKNKTLTNNNMKGLSKIIKDKINKNKKKFRFIFFSLVIIIILIAVLKIYSQRRIKDKKVETNYSIKVSTYKIKEIELIPEIRSFGTISFQTKVDIHPKTSGRIQTITVEEGEIVKKGSVLATLEQFQLKLDLKQAEAELDASKSELELKKSKYKDALRNIESQFLTIEKAKIELKDKKNSSNNLKNTLNNKKKLFKAGAVTAESIKNLETQYHSEYTKYVIAKKDLNIQEIGFRDQDIKDAGFNIPEDQNKKIDILKKLNTLTLKKEIEVAESKVKIAQTKVDSVNAFLRETYIRSPINGIVAARVLEIGEEAKPDNKIFTVMDTKNVYANINISESDLVRIKPNGEVIITVDALDKKEINGNIKLISPVIDAKTRTVQVKVIINNIESNLIPGMFVRARIKSNEKRKTIFIPASSLISVEKENAVVFIIKKDIVFRRNIKIGSEKNEMIEVLDGLKNDDIIVDNPPIDLVEGSKVEIQEEQDEKKEIQ